MERVWRRVQGAAGAGRRGATGRCGCPSQPCQLHADERAKRGGGGRKSRGPRTIVCGCEVQPCPVHPVLVRTRRTKTGSSSRDREDPQDCSGSRTPRGRARRCGCGDRPCRHHGAGTTTPSRAASKSCGCQSRGSRADGVDVHDEMCECVAKQCSHTIKTRRPRGTSCDCVSQPCPIHSNNNRGSSDGRIKRVKCRVRRAGCAMARCTAELAMLHLHWELATECAPCRPRALTRRLCRRQQSDNELYRSNSFKFERFERSRDEYATPSKKQKMEGGLYPDLNEKFKCENVCPICLTEMVDAPKYECENGHVLCHRCKPYFYSCSVCQSHLNLVASSSVEGDENEVYYTPPPSDTDFLPCHGARHRHGVWRGDFLENERRAWKPPPPSIEQHFVMCRYVIYGCYIKLPESLRELHEIRCQFRPYLEVEQLPTDLPIGDEVASCAYEIVGCHAKMPPWRKPIHEPLCIYKEKFEAYDHDDPDTVEDPVEADPSLDELVECKLIIYGCRVRMPRRRKEIHEEKCNYNKYYNEEDFPDPIVPEEEPEPEEEAEPDARVDCQWAEFGCKVKPKFCRKDAHEEKCNYRVQPCAFIFNGCGAMLTTGNRFAHEKICEFRYIEQD